MKFKDYLIELEEQFIEEVRILETNLIKMKFNLEESKQVGTIYHFTEPIYIENIIKSNKLKLGKENYISFTRNPNLTYLGHFNSFEYVIRLAFDGDRMSNNLKISPIKDNKYSDESEEAVLKEVSLKYLKQIDIKPNNIYNKQMLDYIFDLCKKYNIKCNLVNKWNVV